MPPKTTTRRQVRFGDTRTEVLVATTWNQEPKPTTEGYVATSRGQRVKVDELDMAVLNLGHGGSPLTNQQMVAAGRGNFRRPIYNVEPGIQEQHGVPIAGGLDPQSHEVPGDANDPETIRRSTGLSQFDEIHAVNPYGYDPVAAAQGLLAPQGQLVVSGTERNPFAHPANESGTATARTAGGGTAQVRRMAYREADLSNPRSTTPGTMEPLHQSLPQTLSNGNPLNTSSSQSHTYSRIPRGYVDVTPEMDEETLRNTANNLANRRRNTRE